VVTEPRAVATGLLSHADVFNKQRAGRYRSRFCNDRAMASNQLIQLHRSSANAGARLCQSVDCSKA